MNHILCSYMYCISFSRYMPGHISEVWDWWKGVPISNLSSRFMSLNQQGKRALLCKQFRTYWLLWITAMHFLDEDLWQSEQSDLVLNPLYSLFTKHSGRSNGLFTWLKQAGQLLYCNQQAHRHITNKENMFVWVLCTPLANRWFLRHDRDTHACQMIATRILYMSFGSGCNNLSDLLLLHCYAQTSCWRKWDKS